jgi:hypothetical protein
MGVFAFGSFERRGSDREFELQKTCSLSPVVVDFEINPPTDVLPLEPIEQPTILYTDVIDILEVM